MNQKMKKPLILFFFFLIKWEKKGCFEVALFVFQYILQESSFSAPFFQTKKNFQDLKYLVKWKIYPKTLYKKLENRIQNEVWNLCYLTKLLFWFCFFFHSSFFFIKEKKKIEKKTTKMYNFFKNLNRISLYGGLTLFGIANSIYTGIFSFFFL